MAHVFIKDNNCAILFWNPSKNIEVMVWTNPDGRKVAHT